jgi:hypothetical protein
MTDEKTRPRLSKGWYIWAAASAVMIVADMAVYGVRFFNMWPAMLSIVFAFLMFSGRRAQDWAIAYVQELPPRTGRPNSMPVARRYDLLGMLDSGLWSLWVVLLACALAFPMIGDSNLSDAFNIAMIVLTLVAGSIRMFVAAALFR